MADDSNSFLWFLAGLGIGAVVGVLYAPASGRETRESLLEKAEEGRDFVRSRAHEAKEQASHWAERGREVLDRQKDQFKHAFQAGREAYHEATEGGGTTKS